VGAKGSAQSTSIQDKTSRPHLPRKRPCATISVPLVWAVRPMVDRDERRGELQRPFSVAQSTLSTFTLYHIPMFWQHYRASLQQFSLWPSLHCTESNPGSFGTVPNGPVRCPRTKGTVLCDGRRHLSCTLYLSVQDRCGQVQGLLTEAQRARSGDLWRTMTGSK